MIPWACMGLVVLFGFIAIVYVHEERMLMKQWVMNELWHARLAHLKECHPEMLTDDEHSS